jgi:NADH:ubiquinone oxidoreductase subunit H
LWFVLKLLAVVVISEFLTTVFARLRIDQVVKANWKIILPLSVAAFALTVALGVWVYRPMLV